MLLRDILKDLNFRQILTSRGYPTVEVDFILEYCIIRSSIPSGASTGKKEVINKLDGIKEYNGRSVLNVIKSVEEYKEKFLILIFLLLKNLTDF